MPRPQRLAGVEAVATAAWAGASAQRAGVEADLVAPVWVRRRGPQLAVRHLPAPPRGWRSSACRRWASAHLVLVGMPVGVGAVPRTVLAVALAAADRAALLAAVWAGRRAGRGPRGGCGPCVSPGASRSGMSHASTAPNSAAVQQRDLLLGRPDRRVRGES